VVTSIDGFIIEEKNPNMFGVGVFMEEFSWVLVIGKLLFF